VWLASKEKQKQYKLMINILDLYYLTPNLNQWEVSKKLGVSDSLISGYRKMIDQLLQDLGFLTIEEAKRFQVALKNKLEDSQ
jgi:DNA-binding transcriptional regulator LsrR (DeoR family)